MSRTKNYLLLAAPTTPNGDLHLGHMAGPYLAADVLKRYLRLCGHDARYVCGTDDHISYVPYFAEREGFEAGPFVQERSQMISRSLTGMNAEPDVFIRPYQSAEHAQEVQAYCKTMLDNGNLEIRDVETAYCEPCGHYLSEVNIVGKCPFCSSETGGYCCEECGMTNGFGADIVDPVCATCGEAATYRNCRRLFLPLSRYTEFLRDYHARFDVNQRVRALCDRILELGLRDMPVSHVSDWGIPTDALGVPGSRFHSIFEMVPLFVGGSRRLAARRDGDWQEPWRPEGDGMVPFFGYDNAFFFTVLFPVVYHAYSESMTPPSYLKSNEFYQLDSEKFSTSRLHVIWCRDLVRDYSSDVARFYLSYTRPERNEANFTMADFTSTIESELVQGWLGFLGRLGRLVHGHFGGRAPAPWNLRTTEQITLYKRLERLRDDLETAYRPATFSSRAAARSCCEWVRTIDESAEAEVHWQDSPSRQREFGTSVALQLMAAKSLAVAAAPLMPEFANRLWKALGYDGDSLMWQDMLSWVAPGQTLGDFDDGLLIVRRDH